MVQWINAHQNNGLMLKQQLATFVVRKAGPIH